MNRYKVLKKQVFTSGIYSIVPIRFEDRYLIMRWRNEQIYHLRQSKPLTEEDQDQYFGKVVSQLFDQDKPDQILFSFLKDEQCIGYGGLVHINWKDQNAEISFIMNTALEKESFELYWKIYLGLIQKVAFEQVGLHKIFTYAYDLRPRLFDVLEDFGFENEARLFQHYKFYDKFIDVLIHSKIINKVYLRKADENDLLQTFQWANNQDVRKFSFSKENIEWSDHFNWFISKLKSNSCEYYILEKINEKIGSIRFDIDANGYALISYLVDPAYHGKGYGKLILKLGIERLRAKRREVKRVYGYVQPSNIASIKIFEQLGFRKSTTNDNITKFEKDLQL
jgi:RimJ/RimL family protein N-acetyltransferase